MKKDKAPDDFRLYLYSDPSQIKLLLILCPIAFSLGAFSIFLCVMMIRESPVMGPIFGGVLLGPTLFLMWGLTAYGYACCYWDWFRLADNRFETRVFPHKRLSCSREEVASFGQGEFGSIGLFSKDGSLMLYVPRMPSMKKDAFLTLMRSRLAPLGIPELSKDDAEKLLCEAGKL